MNKLASVGPFVDQFFRKVMLVWQNCPLELKTESVILSTIGDLTGVQAFHTTHRSEIVLAS